MNEGATPTCGEVEGVKYDRVGVVSINAVKERQAQIEPQQKQIEKQRAEIEQLKERAAEVDELKALICGQQPGAAFCKRQDKLDRIGSPSIGKSLTCFQMGVC
jgi:hypothetical protein